MDKEEEAQSAQDERVFARSIARLSLAKRQFYMGMCLFLSGIFGIFLLATDRSLWILAVSHAYGLVAIVAIDLLVGMLSLLFVKQVYILSIVGAVFGVLLQVGDIATAPQYHMTRRTSLHTYSVSGPLTRYLSRNFWSSSLDCPIEFTYEL